jgi:Nucleotidyltransferase domain
VFGSIVRGEKGRDSDLDLLVDMGERRGLFEQSSLRGDLEDLLGCRVQVVTTAGLKYAHVDVRERIDRFDPPTDEPQQPSDRAEDCLRDLGGGSRGVRGAFQSASCGALGTISAVRGRGRIVGRRRGGARGSTGVGG